MTIKLPSFLDKLGNKRSIGFSFLKSYVPIAIQLCTYFFLMRALSVEAFGHIKTIIDTLAISEVFILGASSSALLFSPKENRSVIIFTSIVLRLVLAIPFLTIIVSLLRKVGINLGVQDQIGVLVYFVISTGNLIAPYLVSERRIGLASLYEIVSKMIFFACIIFLPKILPVTTSVVLSYSFSNTLSFLTIIVIVIRDSSSRRNLFVAIKIIMKRFVSQLVPSVETRLDKVIVSQSLPVADFAIFSFCRMMTDFQKTAFSMATDATIQHFHQGLGRIVFRKVLAIFYISIVGASVALFLTSVFVDVFFLSNKYKNAIEYLPIFFVSYLPIVVGYIYLVKLGVQGRYKEENYVRAFGAAGYLFALYLSVSALGIQGVLIALFFRSAIFTLLTITIEKYASLSKFGRPGKNNSIMNSKGSG